MITEQLYETYLDLLLEGNRTKCVQLIQDLLDKQIDIKDLYLNLFQKSLYKVGELWEYNKISVAKEHLATSITEGLLTLVYPRLFKARRTSKKAVISCSANEYHQVGGKMVADIFELNGWDGYFLGANTPIDELLSFIDEKEPDLVGLSLSVYFNLPSLKAGIEAIRADFRKLDIVVGGRAFLVGGTRALKPYTGTHYIESLDALEIELMSN
jgi:methanogenic corrinoid protein MtbC1